MTTENQVAPSDDEQGKLNERAVYVPDDLIKAGVGSKNHVYKMLSDGSIPCTKLGKKILVQPEWVHANTNL